MRIIGIVAEYNPFHNGHYYQIQEVKKLYPDSLLVAVMSGNYVQRGDMAIINKYTRAEIAVKNGIDLVIELPFPFSCQNAELFSSAAINELIKVGVSAISFGCETENINLLKKIAEIQINNTSEYEGKLKHKISQGLSYPAAVSSSISEILESLVNSNTKKSDFDLTTISTNNENITSTILSPNNTLAIEYIRACMNKSFYPDFIPVRRNIANHNDLSINNYYASATAIRKAIFDNNFIQIKNVVPKYTYSILKSYCSPDKSFNTLSNYLNLIYYKIISLGKDKLKNIYDINEGIENRIFDNVYKHNTLDAFIMSIKSKRYTYARIQRILLNILLDITKDDIFKAKNYCNNYIRVLAFNDNGKQIIRSAKENGTAIITKYSDFKRNGIDTDKDLCFRLTSKASNIYNIFNMDKNKLMNTEYLNNAVYVRNTDSI